jgi:hypothetical protein
MRLSPTQREIAKLRLQVANLQNALLRRDETILDLRRELGALKRKELYRLTKEAHSWPVDTLG